MSRNIYEDYYLRQAGYGLPVFIGSRYQRGHGLGNILGGLTRAIVPMLKRGGQAILKEGARSGMGVLSDVLAGQSFKQAAQKRSKEAGKRLLGRASQVLGAPPGQPESKRIKRRSINSIAHLQQHRSRRRTGKNKRSKDIFD